MTNLPKIILKPHKEAFVRAGHPWIFSNAIEGGPVDEDRRRVSEVGLVQILANDGKFLGVGMFNPKTSISVRMLSTDENVVVDKEFFKKRFSELEERKKRFLPNETTGYRLVNADADWLPGLIIDRYEDVFVFQIHTAGMDICRDIIIEALKEAFDAAAIVERSDIDARKQDYLTPLPVKTHHGNIDGPVLFKENGVKFFVDVLTGQKTGFFLDQRDARRKIGELANGRATGHAGGGYDGQGKKVLNLFAYTGGFGLYAALNGAAKVTTIDISEPAIKLAKENFKINGLAVNDEKYDFICADVFDYLNSNEIKSEMFDLIICDPPAFAKSNDKVDQAKKAYTDLNMRCMELLKEGGILMTSSCSGRITQEDFRDILKISAGRSRKDLRVLATLAQPFDHTERVCFPEGRYLKTFVLECI